ncbi:patatin-like phospholipase family protein [Enterococcus sp.]|uniref:patatin-like phospholipase family protein n=1 Tax=Enterococcus sp. TaxID=35783 RepID=UPI00290B2E85|nr:patatin-like phospholipase family protein [Enterococcus sp.]MDU5335091.1 patatin-like phospholipase family protein [Enterococcus sp.]
MDQSLGIVLGGGGITGLVWETGILAGLLNQGIDLSRAHKILGTSAGSFVGATLANHYDMKDYLDRVSDSSKMKEFAEVSPEVYQLWTEAFMVGGSNKETVGQKMGEIIYTHPSKVSREKRMEIVRNRLVRLEWPQNLFISAVDAKTGKLHIFDCNSGISLIEAVSASGAVPGVWPHMSFFGSDWIDGGMVSPTNAEYMVGCDTILLLAPLNKKYGLIPSVRDEAEKLSEHSRVILVEPDEQSNEAIGTNIYDSSNVLQIGQAAFKQGVGLAASFDEAGV